MVNYGEGIDTGKKVFNNDELKDFNNLKSKVDRLSKIDKDLTEINSGFDKLVELVKEFGINNKIRNTPEELMREICKVRDKTIQELKESSIREG